MPRRAKESGEDRLIARHFKPLARHPGALGLIDDAAVLKVPTGHDLVLTGLLPQVHEVFQVIGFDALFRILPDRAAAMAALAA